MRTRELMHEIRHHSPFTLLATVIAILFVFIFLKKGASEDLFEILHPLHIVASSIITASIFYIYKKNIPQAIFVGIIGSIVIGTFSDAIFPWLGGIIFGLNTEFHLPIIEQPLTVLIAATLGSTLGIATKLTKLPHFIHVFLSVFASLFYLLAFSAVITPVHFLISFVIVFISVIIPCCLSDILFPFFFLGEKIKHCNCH